MSVSRGPAAEDLVYLSWFVGNWACTVDLVRAEAGSKGKEGLAAVLPAAAAALRASADAVGTKKARKNALCTWQPTSIEKNGLSAGFAVEEQGGICAGTVAAAAVIAGPDADVKPVKNEDAAWDMTGPGIPGKWRLLANAAVAQPDVDGPDSLRVSEVFDVVATPDGKDTKTPPKVSAVVRVVTQYRRVPVGGAAKASAGTEAGEYCLQALQTASLFAPPATLGGDPGSEELVTYESVLLFSAVNAKTAK